jgi:anti-sigma factor RsiW
MQCDLMRDGRAQGEISAFIDGELPEPAARELGAHLQACAVCAALAADYRRLGRQLRIGGRVPASEALQTRVRAALSAASGIEAGAGSAGVAAPPPLPQPRKWSIEPIVRQAAILAAVCLLSVLATWFALSDRNRLEALEREVLSAHVRALLQDTPVQVASSDQHTVRPWFTGRLEFAPDVKDLSADGFPLAGARLDYVDGRRVAALVYRRRLHVINVFTWPGNGGPRPVASPGAGGDAAPVLAVRNGYNVLHWRRSGAAYWAVSDLNATELRQLQGLL